MQTGVSVMLAWTDSGRPGVGLMIPAIFVKTPDGDVPGLVISPASARQVAYSLLLHAEGLCNGAMPPPMPEPVTAHPAEQGEG